MGIEELPVGALIMEVAAADVDVVAAPEGATIDERLVAVEAMAVAGDENLGRVASTAIDDVDD